MVRLCYIFKNMLENIDIDTIINDFASKATRRIMFFIAYVFHCFL